MNTSNVKNPQGNPQPGANIAGMQNTSQASTYKEREIGGSAKVPEYISEIKENVELPEDVEAAGVIAHKESFEIPPDLKKMGMAQVGSTVGITPQSLPQVALPVTDTVVYEGVHAHVATAMRWLATWCIRRLKKAHLLLKKVHGKIIRIKFA